MKPFLKKWHKSFSITDFPVLSQLLFVFQSFLFLSDCRRLYASSLLYSVILVHSFTTLHWLQVFKYNPVYTSNCSLSDSFWCWANTALLSPTYEPLWTVQISLLLCFSYGKMSYNTKPNFFNINTLIHFKWVGKQRVQHRVQSHSSVLPCCTQSRLSKELGAAVVTAALEPRVRVA